MAGKIFSFFGRGGQTSAANPGPPPQRRNAAVATGGKLFTDQAVDALAEMLGGVIPDPDEVLKRLSRPRSALRLLTFDPEIAAALDTRREAVISTPWRLEPSEGAETAFLLAELEPHITTLLRGAWSAVPFGYSVMEVVYAKRPDGRIGIGRIAEKPFEWFVPRSDGTLRWLPPDGSGGMEGIEVSPAKFLLTRINPTYANPYGEALLSRVYWPWHGASQNNKFWLQFLERFGTPLMVGTTVGDREQLAAALNSAVQDAAIAVSEGTTIQAIAPNSNGESFDRYASAAQRQIQRVILGQTLTSDVGKSGSYAAAKVHNDVREDRRNADLRTVSATVQQMVDLLVAFNFPALPEPVRFIMEDAQGIEAERATRDKTLHEALPGLTFTPEYLSDVYGLDREHFTIEEPAPTPLPTIPPGGSAAPPVPKSSKGAGDAVASLAHGVAFAASTRPRFDAGQMEIEALAESALAAARATQPIDPHALRAAIDRADGPEALVEELAALVDPGEGDFVSLVERALFAADLIGYGAARAELGR